MKYSFANDSIGSFGTFTTKTEQTDGWETVQTLNQTANSLLLRNGVDGIQYRDVEAYANGRLEILSEGEEDDSELENEWLSNSWDSATVVEEQEALIAERMLV